MEELIRKTIRLSQEMWDELEAVANREHRSLNSQLIVFVEDGIKKSGGSLLEKPDPQEARQIRAAFSKGLRKVGKK